MRCNTFALFKNKKDSVLEKLIEVSINHEEGLKNTFTVITPNRKRTRKLEFQ